MCDTRCVCVISVCDPVLGDHGSMVRFVHVVSDLADFYCLSLLVYSGGVFSVLGGLFVIRQNSDSHCVCISHTDMFFKGFALSSVIVIFSLCFVIPSCCRSAVRSPESLSGL